MLYNITIEVRKTNQQGESKLALKKEYLNVAKLFLEDPETGEALMIVSDLILEGNGKYSFIVGNDSQTVFWKHTIRTEELSLEDYSKSINQ
jgi:hypothetical protein